MIPTYEFEPGKPVEITNNGVVYKGYLKNFTANYNEGLGEEWEFVVYPDHGADMAQAPGVVIRDVSEYTRMFGVADRTVPMPIQSNMITKGPEMKYNATLIRDKARRRTNVYLEIVGKEDTYIGADGDEHVRKMGEEMPLYGTFPDEILGPILAAASSAEFYDHSRQCFRLS